MRKTIIVAAFVAFGFSGLASTPAMADCAADIERIQEELKGPNPNVKSGAWTGAKKMLKKAKAARADGDDKKCEKLLKKAQGKIDAARR